MKMKAILSFLTAMAFTVAIFAQNNTLNGVNVDQLVATVGAVKNDGAIAKFQFRSHTKWINGGHCETTIQGFYGANQEDQSRKKPLIMVGDEPAVLLGANHGPNAVEAVLHALASCLSVGIVYNAAAMGIQVDALEFDIEGDLDLHCFLGLSETLRPGYENLVVTITAETSASTKEFNELLEYVKRTSPVLDIISNPVPVVIKSQHDMPEAKSGKSR